MHGHTNDTGTQQGTRKCDITKEKVCASRGPCRVAGCWLTGSCCCCDAVETVAVYKLRVNTGCTSCEPHAGQGHASDGCPLDEGCGGITCGDGRSGIAAGGWGTGIAAMPNTGSMLRTSRGSTPNEWRTMHGHTDDNGTQQGMWKCDITQAIVGVCWCLAVAAQPKCPSYRSRQPGAPPELEPAAGFFSPCG
jgi:hypothetical protein